jgi:mono/diheme cytochrome c family protein
MRSIPLRSLLFVGLMLGMLVVWPAYAGVPASRPAQAQVEHGKYLAQIAGCITCHTPFQARYADLGALPLDDLRTLSFSEHDALDMSRLLAGGRPFDLGPGGVVQSSNLTPDDETGLGKWTDAEIKSAIRTGAVRGRQLHPIMPYVIYNNMAESDLDAIVAYLRSLPAVSNEIPDGANFPAPPPPVRQGLVAPDPANAAERGKYLVSAVVPCAHCHTSVDNVTGQPDPQRFLAGGQPYEGPWGIVYAANITPDQTTGIGAWSDAALHNVLRSGVDKDGRRLVLMPWQDYAMLSAQDAAAIVYTLRHDVAPVVNQVPAASLRPEFDQRAPQAAETPSPARFGVPAALAAVAALIVGAAVVARRRRQVAGR